MFGWLLNYLSTIVDFLGDTLPDSPFASVTQGMSTNDIIQSALGWLNWFVPIGSMSALMAAWLLIALAWLAVTYFLDKATGVVDKLIGG